MNRRSFPHQTAKTDVVTHRWCSALRCIAAEARITIIEHAFIFRRSNQRRPSAGGAPAPGFLPFGPALPRS
jgi:hypothetical protein